MTVEQLGSSFRDPSGFVFRREGELLRQVNSCYASHYELLRSSGLYATLVGKEWLIEHQETERGDSEIVGAPDAYRIIRPVRLPYVSYPYEWCFSQLKDAALLTLDIQAEALMHGMTLKDASAYNVQFVGCRPVFIDTLSFERHEEGMPWIAYRQFCQHFLAPLAVMARRDVRLRHLLKSYIDGIPLDLASSLLPLRTFANYSLLAHLHLHSASQKRHQDDARSGMPKKGPFMTTRMQQALVASLRSAVDKCRSPKLRTEWGSYYEDTNYSAGAMSAKERMVMELLIAFCDDGRTVHDFGGNTGRFSRLAASLGSYVLCHDIDELAVERNYRFNKQNGIGNILPLMLDVSNPSASLGWALSERESIFERIRGDFVLALALIHHIVISNNVPLLEVAKFFHRLADRLIVEFIPKSDSQVRRLLSTREDIFPNYDIEHFREAFGQYFVLLKEQSIPETERTLFVFQRK